MERGGVREQAWEDGGLSQACRQQDARLLGRLVTPPFHSLTESGEPQPVFEDT